jgi:hypothetical protein
MLRFPRFRFRPGHADALHVDFWIDGSNVLRDAGTFSYNADPETQAYFWGVQGHNTVQFDARDQMPRVGRFLWGDWLRTESVTPVRGADGVSTAGAAYTDADGARHQRDIALGRETLTVRDTVEGFRQHAVLRWRLLPERWSLSGTSVKCGGHQLTVSAGVPVTRCALVEGWESRHYLQKTAAPVLEVEIDRPGVLVTEYRRIA